MLHVCISICPLARLCSRHSINNIPPNVRNQKQSFYQPKLRKKCPGYQEAKEEDIKEIPSIYTPVLKKIEELDSAENVAENQDNKKDEIFSVIGRYVDGKWVNGTNTDKTKSLENSIAQIE